MNDIVIALIGASASIIVGIMSYLAVVSTNKKANNELIHKMEVQRAVTDTKLEELTREVREHNNFARRIPVVENEILHMHNEIKHLESFHEKQ